MPVYIVTGKLGSGKTLLTVSKIKEYICNGRKISTNLDLNLVEMLGKTPKSPRVIRMPDKPRIDDFHGIGLGKPEGHKGEDKNGLLVLDELGTWFNGRDWNDKSRKHLINWLAHSRKKGWDLMLIIQDLSVLDKQAQVMFAEHVVYCMRTDRLSIPFVGWMLNLSGFNAKLGKMHRGLVKYGSSKTDPTVDRWWYRGNDLYRAYNTDQEFHDREPTDSDWFGNYSLLTPWQQAGRYMVPRDWGFYMRMTKVYWRRFSKITLGIGFGVIGSIVGAFMAGLVNANTDASVINQAAGIASVKSSEQIDTETKTNIHVEELKLNIRNLKIIEFTRVNGVAPDYVFEDREGNQFYGEELLDAGYRMTYLSYCRLKISSGSRNHIVRCKYNIDRQIVEDDIVIEG